MSWGLGVDLTASVATFAEKRDFQGKARDATRDALHPGQYKARDAACRNALLRGSRYNIPEESLAPADVAGLHHVGPGLFSVFAE